jgi:hypothetical protein
MAPKNTLPGNFDRKKFIEVIDGAVELRGMRVVFYDGRQLQVLREGPPLCEPGLKSIVIKPDLGEVTVQSESAAQSRESHLYLELISGAVGCSGAVVSWLLVFGGGAAAPITGGAPTFISALAATGAVASSIQCGNSMVRVYGELGHAEVLGYLDSVWWYGIATRGLDAISLVGVGTSTYATIRMAIAVRNATGKAMIEVLKGLSRQERKKLAEELIRHQNPNISNSALKTLVRAGVYPKRFSMQSVNVAVTNQLRDALNAAMSFTGSAMSGLIREGTGYAIDSVQDKTRPAQATSASGRGYVVGMAQTFETY